jgi:iron complex outermembrane receptor protein
VPGADARPARAEPDVTGAPETPNVQDTTASEHAQAKLGGEPEIVVTGTLIRGVAPTGSPVLSLSDKDITASGAANSSQVLAKLPQVTSFFNATPSPGGGPLTTIARPDIRRLNATAGGFGAGGNATLVLVDGHKVVGAGTTFETPDPDIIPAVVLQRVEVITDGGSSIYGADAVGGVINYITRSSFDGVQLSLRGGGAPDYYSVDGSVIAGTSWSSGSVYGAYAFMKHDAIFGRDRSYVNSLVSQSGACSPGTVFAAVPGATPGSFVRTGPSLLASTLQPGTTTCDASDNATIYPSEERHSIFGSLKQELSPALTFELKGFYTDRHLGTAQDPNFRNNISTGLTINSASPFYRPVAGDTGTQIVNFNYSGLADFSGKTKIKEWGITPTLRIDLGGNWQARLLGHYGKSRTIGYEFILAGGTQPAINAGLLNPYNPSASAPGAFNNIFAVNYQESDQELWDGRLVVDGPLFALPGGDAKVAVGAEYTRNNVKRGANTALLQTAFEARDFSSLTRGKQSRDLKSVFGEISLPIIDMLTLNASVRYDDYSDFGTTTNPKFGMRFEPIKGLAFRGSWGTSFTAPALVDTTTVGSLVFARPNSPFVAPTAPPGSASRPTIFVLGGNPNLGPQTATTWSIGADIAPVAVSNLKINATYFNVHFKDQIGLTPFTNTSVAFSSAFLNQSVFVNPSQGTIETIASQVQSILGPFLAGFPNTVAGLLAASAANPPYALIDTRKQNLGQLKVEGIDLNVTYVIPVSFGELSFRAAGTYTLGRKFSAAAGLPFVDEFDNPGMSRLLSVVSAGAKSGGFEGLLTWNHSAGYKIPTVTFAGNGIVPAVTQTKIRSFNTVDAFLSYSFENGLLANTQVTLNINNIFNEKPPFDARNPDFGYGNGATLGRLIQLGVTKKF